MFDIMWEDGWLLFSYLCIYTYVATSYTRVSKPRKNAKYTLGQGMVSNRQLFVTEKNTLISTVNFTLSIKYYLKINEFLFEFFKKPN